MKLDVGTKICLKINALRHNEPVVGKIIGFATDQNFVDSKYIVQWESIAKWCHYYENEIIKYSGHPDWRIWHVDFQERIRDRMT